MSLHVNLLLAVSRVRELLLVELVLPLDWRRDLHQTAPVLQEALACQFGWLHSSCGCALEAVLPKEGRRLVLAALATVDAGLSEVGRRAH